MENVACFWRAPERARVNKNIRQYQLGYWAYISKRENFDRAELEKYQKPCSYPCAIVLPLFWLGNNFVIDRWNSKLLENTTRETGLVNCVYCSWSFGGSQFAGVITSVAESLALSTVLETMKNYSSPIIQKDSTE